MAGVLLILADVVYIQQFEIIQLFRESNVLGSISGTGIASIIYMRTTITKVDVYRLLCSIFFHKRDRKICGMLCNKQSLVVKITK